jgi:hypothetical protein
MASNYWDSPPGGNYGERDYVFIPVKEEIAYRDAVYKQRMVVENTVKLLKEDFIKDIDKFLEDHRIVNSRPSEFRFVIIDALRLIIESTQKMILYEAEK